MRLRTRLLIALTPIALVPLMVVLPFAQSNLRRTLSREVAERLEAAGDAAEASLADRRDEVLRAVEELVDSTAAEELARSLHGGAPLSRQANAAGRMMTARGLTVLSIFDARGTTVSSGHLPARLGDPDERLFALTSLQKDRRPQVVLVEVRDEAGVREAPALVVSRPIDYGDFRLYAVGGILLDAALAEQLAQLTRARVELLRDGQVRVTAGKAAPPLAERELALGEGVTVRLALSRAAEREARAGITRAFLGVAGLAFALSLALGLWASRWITGSIEALTEGARKVAAGDLEAKVVAKASGEVGELIRTFNSMTAELKRTTEQLVASERIAAWQEVARRLAHEIKNPLTPIKMSLETLIAANQAHSPRFDALFQESAGVVLEEVERLRRIVDEFSRFARLPKPVLEDADLTELARQILALYASSDGVRIVPELDGALPVRIDRDQLTQVLVNLIKNAAEAMPEGGTVWVRTSAAGGQARLEVEDSGPGIRAEERARIFEPYFTTKEGGSGLGLAIASRICQEHGGALEVDSPEGRGAVFRVVLPAISPSPASP